MTKLSFTNREINMETKVKPELGPTCACGKVDLYAEWLKQNEAKEKKETFNSTSSNQTGSEKNSDDETGKDNQKQEQSKK